MMKRKCVLVRQKVERKKRICIKNSWYANKIEKHINPKPGITKDRQSKIRKLDEKLERQKFALQEGAYKKCEILKQNPNEAEYFKENLRDHWNMNKIKNKNIQNAPEGIEKDNSDIKRYWIFQRKQCEEYAKKNLMENIDKATNFMNKKTQMNERSISDKEEEAPSME